MLSVTRMRWKYRELRTNRIYLESLAVSQSTINPLQTLLSIGKYQPDLALQRYKCRPRGLGSLKPQGSRKSAESLGQLKARGNESLGSLKTKANERLAK